MNIGKPIGGIETKKRSILRKNILQVLRMRTTNVNKSHHLADLFAIETFRYIDFGNKEDL